MIGVVIEVLLNPIHSPSSEKDVVAIFGIWQVRNSVGADAVDGRGRVNISWRGILCDVRRMFVAGATSVWDKSEMPVVKLAVSGSRRARRSMADRRPTMIKALFLSFIPSDDSSTVRKKAHPQLRRGFPGSLCDEEGAVA